jgi:hypothetical protein
MTWIISKALMKDYESLRSSQGRGEESSAGSCSDGELSAPSSGTDMHGTFWSPGKTTDVLKPSRSGMTFRPLTDDLGEAVLMSCLEDFPVRTFHAPEKVQESKGNEAPCGNTWRESSAKFDLATHSWKTHQCLWEEDLLESSVTLPKWGMMRSGVLWERTTPGLLTSGTESGSWRTPSAHEPGVSAERLVPIEGGTPGGMNRHFDKHTGRMAQIGLIQQVMLREMRPTPCARDHKGVSGSGRQAKRGNPQDTLCNAVAGRTWPTPTAQDAKNNGSPSQMVRNTKPLNAEVGGQLNPTWVEWLMGWSAGWTDCAVLVTDKFQQWQNSHGRF